MSNFYGVNGEVKKRVIDSNERVREKLEKLQGDQRFTPISFAGEELPKEAQEGAFDPDAFPEGEVPEGLSAEQESEFVEGLIAEQLTPSATDEEPIDPVEQARQEAEAILNNAHAEADGILENARQEAEQLRQNAFSEGEAAGREAVEAEYQARFAELEEQRTALETEYARKSEELETDMLDTMLDIFRQTFEIKYGDDRALLLYLVKNGLRNIRETKSYKIKVAEADVAAVREAREQFVEIVGSDASLDIVMDVSLPQGSCVIDADSGVYDCSFTVQLDNLCKELRALSIT